MRKQRDILGLVAITLIVITTIPAFSSPRKCNSTMATISEYTSFEVTVESYYRNIDQGDLESVIAIFSQNATYSRGNFLDLNSKNEIENFYSNKRTLLGTHTLRSIRVKGNAVFVSGIFSGTTRGEPIQTNFSDLWLFNKNSGLVEYRKSWIEVPGI